MEEREKVLGQCSNCNQTKSVSCLGTTSILMCDDCRDETIMSYLSGRKIYTVTDKYQLPDAVNRGFLVEELREMHGKIHDNWFYMKTGQYELYHYLVIRELFALGEDPSEMCHGELKDLYNRRRDLASQYYRGG